jgi:hypothetical protein
MCNDFGYDSINYGAAPIVVNPYGSYFDTTIQNAIASNTPYAMKFNNIDIQNGVSLNAGTQFQVLNNGVYNLQFSAQLFRTGGGNSQHIDIWIRKNGIDVPSSDTKVNVNANAVYLVAAWNWFVQMNAGDSVEIMWAVSDVRIQLQYDPANLVVPHPEIPSVIATISKVS